MAMKIAKAIQNKSFKTHSLKSMRFTNFKFNLPFPFESGGFSSVFKVQLNHQHKAFRVLLKNIDNLAGQYQKIKSYLSNDTSNYFINFDFFPKELNTGQRQHDCMLMDWADGVNLKKYVQKNLGNPYLIKQIAQQFLQIAQHLEKRNMSHGDLHHGNILVRNQQLVLIDYDGLYVPTMGTAVKDMIKGKSGYQHPTLRKQNAYKNQFVDRFSVLVIYLSLLAIAEQPSLYNSQNVEDNDDGFLFTPEELQDRNSTIFSHLNHMSITVKQTKDLLLQALGSYNLQSIPLIGHTPSSTVTASTTGVRVAPIPDYLKKIQVRKVNR